MSRGSVSHNYGYISTYSNAIQQISSDRFVLKIRQQPIQTRLSTNNERDRRPLDPPPIVQIELENSTIQETQEFLQNPYLFMCVSLINYNTHEEIVSSTQNTLSGQTSSSMYKLKDINNHDGGFFVFGDVSVKLEGQFRLKFSMFEISKYGATNLKSICSNVFQVYSSKSFPGMLESTFLSRSFSDQGVRIRIRKEHRVQMTGSRKRKLSSQDELLETEERQSHIDRSHIQNYHSQQQYIQPGSESLNHATNSYHHHPTSIVYQNHQRSQHHHHHWPSAADNINAYDNRRGSLNSVLTANSDISLNPRRLSHIDRRPSVPFSPPHQSYDNSRVKMGSNDFKNNNTYDYNHFEKHYNHQQLQYQHVNPHHRNCMIPSPPPQSLFKPELRRMSLDESLPNGTLNNTLRRQSADPHLYHPINQYRREPRRMSLQQYSPHVIHPQTRSPNNNLGGEVIHLPPLRSLGTNTSQRQQRTTSHLSPPKHHYHQQDGIVEVDAAVAMMQLASRRQAEAKVNY